MSRSHCFIDLETPETFVRRLLGDWQSQPGRYFHDHGFPRLAAMDRVVGDNTSPDTLAVGLSFFLLTIISVTTVVIDRAFTMHLPGEDAPNNSMIDTLRNAIFLSRGFEAGLFFGFLLLFCGIKKMASPYQQNDTAFRNYFDKVKESFGEAHPYFKPQQSHFDDGSFESFHLQVITSLLGRYHRANEQAHDKLDYWRAVAFILMDFGRTFPHGSSSDIYIIPAEPSALNLASPLSDTVVGSLHTESRTIQRVVHKPKPKSKRFITFKSTGSLNQVDRQILKSAAQNTQLEGEELASYLQKPSAWAEIAQLEGQAAFDGKPGLVRRVLPVSPPLSEQSPADTDSEGMLVEEAQFSPCLWTRQTRWGIDSGMQEQQKSLTNPWEISFVSSQNQSPIYLLVVDENRGLAIASFEIEYFNEVSISARQRLVLQEENNPSIAECQIALLSDSNNVSALLYKKLGRLIKQSAHPATQLASLLSHLLKEMAPLIHNRFRGQGNSDILESSAIYLTALLKSPDYFTQWKFWIAYDPHNAVAFTCLSKDLQVQLIYILLSGPDCAKLTALSLVNAPQFQKKRQAFYEAFRAFCQHFPFVDTGGFNWISELRRSLPVGQAMRGRSRVNVRKHDSDDDQMLTVIR